METILKLRPRLTRTREGGDPNDQRISDAPDVTARDDGHGVGSEGDGDEEPLVDHDDPGSAGLEDTSHRASKRAKQ